MYRCLFSAPRNLNIYKNPSNFIVFHDFWELWVLSKLCHHMSPDDLVLSGFKLASVTCVSSEIGLNPTFVWTFHFLAMASGYKMPSSLQHSVLGLLMGDLRACLHLELSLCFLIRSVYCAPQRLGQPWFHAGNGACAVSGQAADGAGHLDHWAKHQPWVQVPVGSCYRVMNVGLPRKVGRSQGWNLELGQPSAGGPPGGHCRWGRPVYCHLGHLTQTLPQWALTCILKFQWEIQMSSLLMGLWKQHMWDGTQTSLLS